MRNFQKDQADFMAPLADRQPLFSAADVAFRHDAASLVTCLGLYRKLCQEEGNELNDAITELMLAQYNPAGVTIDQMAELIADVADQAFDKIFVVLGVLNILGLDFNSIWLTGWLNNMSKYHVVGDKLVAKFRPDGKLLKPVGWTEPDFVSLVKTQIQRSV